MHTEFSESSVHKLGITTGFVLGMKISQDTGHTAENWHWHWKIRMLDRKYIFIISFMVDFPTSHLSFGGKIKFH